MESQAMDDSADRVGIRQELATMSFEDLLKLKEKLGSKIVNGAIHGNRSDSTVQSFKRENKNRPRETTSKKPTTSLRPVYDIKPTVSRDPRFDDLSGNFNEELFNKSYKFIDDMRNKEKGEVERKIATETDPEKKSKLKSLLQSMTAKEHSKKKKQKIQELKKETKSKQKTDVKQGKRPWFQNKTEIRKLELMERYETLKKSGKLEKYMVKKRKKNATKDKTKLPKQ